MDPDLILSLGLLFGCLSVPAIMSAISDGRSPRGSTITLAIALALIGFAVISKPGGYRIDEIPDAVFGTIGRFTR